ncbi:MAG: hypothetical protein ACREM1_22530 [Longimicrobiales bacterium]
MHYMLLRNAAAGVLLYVDSEGRNATCQFLIPRDDATVRRAAHVITNIARRTNHPHR